MIWQRLRTFVQHGNLLVPSLKSYPQFASSLSLICRSFLSVSLESELNAPGPMEPLSWQPPPPCRVGDISEDVDTPALVVDMDIIDRNLKALSKHMQQYPFVSVRPHVKAHKCPQLAKLQVEHGAVGVCAQTLTEAEAMVYGGGCSNVLLSNQLIGRKKLERLAALAQLADISVCVDSAGNVEEMSEVATKTGITFNCVVEVDVGQARCGLPPGEPVAQLAAHIIALSGVSFKGIQCYQGLNQHVRKVEERQKAVNLVANLTRKCLKALQAQGIPCTYVTGAGTGTFPYEAASGVFTEVQPGSYIFMDADYNRNLDVSGQPARDFDQSLFVMTTVQSVTQPLQNILMTITLFQPGSRAVVDAGMKAVSMDSGVPLVEKYRELTYEIGGDEHGILKPDGGLKVGDLLWLVPGHCDPTVNLYDWLVGIRRHKVEVVWPILARGPGV